MTLLVSYDITNNRLRKKVAEYLIYAGMIRMQKSVFMGYVRRDMKKKVEQKLKALLNSSEDESDKIIVTSIPEKSIISAKLMGYSDTTLVQELTGSIKVRIY